MTVAAFTTPFTSTSYLTVGEYRSAPTGVEVDDLVPYGTDQIQFSELSNVISRASSLADQFCNQVLGATVDVEAKTTWVDRQGRIKVHPDFWPVLEVVDFQYGVQPNLMTSLSDLSNVWVGKQLLYAHLDSLYTTTQGPLGFGSPGTKSQVYVRYAYVNGYPNTALSEPAEAGSSTIEVYDPTGIYGGSATVTATAANPATRLALYDGANTERFITVADVSGSTLTLNAPLAYSHPAHAQVSALPPAVRQAVIFLTSALIKSRGNEAVVMASVSGGPVRSSSPDVQGDLTMAYAALAPFRRVR